MTGCDVKSESLHESLGILAAHLIRGLHPVQVDSFADEHLFGEPYGLSRQEAWPAEDPGVVDVEQAEDVRAGVDDGHAGVVSGQDPVRAVGSNWEEKSQRHTVREEVMIVVIRLLPVSRGTIYKRTK